MAEDKDINTDLNIWSEQLNDKADRDFNNVSASTYKYFDAYGWEGGEK